MRSRTLHLSDGSHLHDVRVDREAEVARLHLGEEDVELKIVSEREGEIVVERDGQRQRLLFARKGEDVWVHLDGETWKLRRTQKSRGDADGDDGATRAELSAPMTGKVTRLAVEAGAEVEEGETVVVVEAMKMEHALRAPFAGTVTALPAVEGNQVDQGEVLAIVEREAPTE